MSNNQKQKSGNNSINAQASGDITLNNNITNNNTIVLYSIEEVSRQLLNSAFGELPETTKEQIKKNQQSYFQELSERLCKIAKKFEEIEQIIISPDFQYISKKAAISAARSTSNELHRNLSFLIIERIHCDNEELKRIIYNEAIVTIERLTQDQLKILTLCLLITGAKTTGLNSLSELFLHTERSIQPFINFRKTKAGFAQLVCTGCVSISSGQVFFGNLSSLFTALFKSKYPEIFKQNEDIEEMLKNSSAMANLLTITRETPLLQMNLTSTGAVLAATHYEQVTGGRIRLDEWFQSSTN